MDIFEKKEKREWQKLFNFFLQKFYLYFFMFYRLTEKKESSVSSEVLKF